MGGGSNVLDRRLALALGAARRGAWDEAAALVRDVLAGGAAPAATVLEPFLWEAYRAGRLAEPLGVFRTLAPRATAPSDMAFLNDAAAVFLYEAADPDAAAFCCRLALEVDSANTRLWANLAACLEAAGRAEEARAVVAQTRRIDPHHLRADYLAARLAPHETANLKDRDPYAMRYARLFLLIVPPFAAAADRLDVSLQEVPGDAWSCVALPASGEGTFPARPGVPVLAATWNDAGLFMRLGTVETVAPAERRIVVRGRAPEGAWIQRRRAFRVSAADFREARVTLPARAGSDATVRDISAGGISFSSVVGVAPGTRVEVGLEFYGERLTAAAIVRRCTPEGDRFLVGAEFLPDDDLMEKLLRRIDPGGGRQPLPA